MLRNKEHMNQSTDARKLPGWTLIVSLPGWLVAPMILWMCRGVGLSWWIGVPTALVVVAVGALLDRAIERRYLPSRRSQ
ncbi:hypothetical protein [Paraburkholderia sp. SIMBA_053]|uniref:hypothetical protein n=1 Tax=Paraburkholderia sp. SIMBA_053 TaxID=3085794 RepID=UPI00397AC610